MIESALAKSIRLVGFDVDGVMTDGGVYLGASGTTRVELKRYDIQDGVGMALLRRTGIRSAILTGRVSESVALRAKELGIEDVAQHPDGYKLDAFMAMLRKHGISPAEAAFVGDDFPDLPILRVVGLPVAVGNAVPEVRAACKVRLTREGGHGAIREFIELLLEARDEWKQTWSGYVAERSAPEGAGMGRE